ncbi:MULTISPECIES: hypothetical protein [Pseudomonas]|uniref:hypothetical protein n=1 Tax=Pseudomonas TaxID=286 RepID=UPI0015DCF281|nr:MULTISPECIES: hypothetical protein [Pseudomonas]MEB3842033.1 hypothetical protein [Pseudomonas guariconensis]MEB3874901.1 hypothetical protein [Pseudomonas guariconensis]MEB3878946.1 hypothetical protein [Pseudomonas guariconensis]MEB3896946.1 hypothetical protein [Pseudomonas guariconensis]BBR51790.1 hypothetical protein WP4W18C03_01170 [Pseudomonas putida]
MISRLPLFLLTLICSQASLGCTLHDSRSEAIYKLNLTDAECRTIEYIDGRIISIRLGYPLAKAVDHSWKGEVIELQLYYVSDHYELGALINNETFLRHDKEYDVYRVFNEEKYVFNGSDSARVIVSKVGHTWLAQRMQKGVLIIYQYNEKHNKLKEMDEFIRHFVDPILARKD